MSGRSSRSCSKLADVIHTHVDDVELAGRGGRPIGHYCWDLLMDVAYRRMFARAAAMGEGDAALQGRRGG